MKFTVDCKTWRFGGDENYSLENNGTTQLLNIEGNMCCLGHCAINMGLSKDNIYQKGTPASVKSSFDYYDDGIDNDETKALRAYLDIFISKDAKHFKGYGHELTFINIDFLTN